MRKPQRISFDSRESSSVLSVSGFFGTSHAVTIAIRAGMSGPLSGYHGTPSVISRGWREQADPSASIKVTMSLSELLMDETGVVAIV